MGCTTHIYYFNRKIITACQHMWTTKYDVCAITIALPPTRSKISSFEHIIHGLFRIILHGLRESLLWVYFKWGDILGRCLDNHCGFLAVVKITTYMFAYILFRLYDKLVNLFIYIEVLYSDCLWYSLFCMYNLNVLFNSTTIQVQG